MPQSTRDRVAALAERARERARDAIREARGPRGDLTLAAIDALSREYEAKREKASQRCAEALEAKRRSVARGAAALEKTATVCRAMDATFESLTENAAAARVELEQFPRAELEELEDARLAACNLAALLTQLDVYAQIPERCASLRADLQANFPQSLVPCYKKAMELELWRAALQRRVSIETDLARQREASGESSTGQDYGLEELAALSRTLSTRVAAVAELAHDVFEAARQPLDGDSALEHALNGEPHHVVAAARVVELHARLRRTTLVPTALEDATRSGEAPADALERLKHSLTGTPARADALSRLFRGARRRCIRVYAETQMRFVDEGKSRVEATLGAATACLADLRGAHKALKPCVPPTWPLVRVYRAVIEAHVAGQLSPFWAREGDLEVAELMRVYEWLRAYNALVGEIDPVNTEDAAFSDDDDETPPLTFRGPSALFAESSEKLMAQYLARVGDQVEGWFGQIQARKAEPRQDVKGRPVTTRPEDMFQIVGLQVSIAREHSHKAETDDGGQHVATVVLRCLEELRGDARRSVERAAACSQAVDAYIATAHASRPSKEDAKESSSEDDLQPAKNVRKSSLGSYDVDSRKPPSLEVEALCAVANDGLRVQERCETLIEGLKQRTREGAKPLEGPALASVEAVKDQVVSDYAEAAVACCRAASQAPLCDLRDAIFAPDSEHALFGDPWEADETKADAIDVATETVDDYLQDFRCWLPSYLYAKAVRAAFDGLVQAYVDRFLRSSRDHAFRDGDQAAMLVLRDQNRLLSYFLPKFTQDDDLASANLRTPESVMVRTGVMRTLADALSASPPGDLDDHVVEDLCALFGEDAPLVVEAILRRHPQCRKRKAILSENVQWCARAAQTCGGAEAPFRMPLEKHRRSTTSASTPTKGRFRAAAHAVIAAKRLDSEG